MGGCMRRRSLPISPYRLYLVLECGMNFLLGIAYATITVYWVTSGRLNPLQLLLLGTALEVSYFLLQLPTGVLADLVSRRCALWPGYSSSGWRSSWKDCRPRSGTCSAPRRCSAC